MLPTLSQRVPSVFHAALGAYMRTAAPLRCFPEAPRFVVQFERSSKAAPLQWRPSAPIASSRRATNNYLLVQRALTTCPRPCAFPAHARARLRLSDAFRRRRGS
eukprot:5389352-Pyramimonas_sp.AAC.1